MLIRPIMLRGSHSKILQRSLIMTSSTGVPMIWGLPGMPACDSQIRARITGLFFRARPWERTFMWHGDFVSRDYFTNTQPTMVLHGRTIHAWYLVLMFGILLWQWLARTGILSGMNKVRLGRVSV